MPRKAKSKSIYTPKKNFHCQKKKNITTAFV